jgi:hypothetical protein
MEPKATSAGVVPALERGHLGLAHGSWTVVRCGCAESANASMSFAHCFSELLFEERRSR